VEVRFPQTKWPEENDFERWVIHEDKSLLILNKPAGLLMHPLGESWLKVPAAALSEKAANLAGLLQLIRPQIAEDDVPRCGIVHRLDRQTSGVLLVAKTAKAYEALIGAFKERRVEKRYRAIIRGLPREKNTHVEAPIGRRPGHRQILVTPFGKNAETAFSIVKAGKSAAIVEARPLTGRTHQIRAHLALIGHPVAGDVEFDHPAEGLPRASRQMLHAYRVAFEHPATGRQVVFSAPLPADFRAFWKLCQ
jgi:23S rRNA pseudouridine1911/1915/1917 synthase